MFIELGHGVVHDEPGFELFVTAGGESGVNSVEVFLRSDLSAKTSAGSGTIRGAKNDSEGVEEEGTVSAENIGRFGDDAGGKERRDLRRDEAGERGGG